MFSQGNTYHPKEKDKLLLPNEEQELEEERSKVYVGIENEEEGGAEGAGT